jgi:hypothetical protein
MDTAWYQRVSGASKRPGAGGQNTALHALILKSGWCVISTHCNETQTADTHEQDTAHKPGGAPSQRQFYARLTNDA